MIAERLGRVAQWLGAEKRLNQTKRLQFPDFCIMEGFAAIL